MEILFANDKLQQIVKDFPKLKKKIGANYSKNLKKRIDQLEAFINLDEFFNSRLDHPHMLSGNFQHEIGWDIDSHYRIILGLIEKPTETFKEDMKKIDKIIFKGVVDYHGNKNNWIIS